MSFHYGQGYRGPGGHTPQHHPSLRGPYGASAPPGGPATGHYGGPVPPGGGPYGGTAQPGAPYGSYGHQRPGGQYGPGGGGAAGGPYGGYGQAYGAPYGHQPPPGNVPPGVSPEAQQWFRTVDTDQSGYISLRELKQALVNSNNTAFNDETCLMMLNMFDKTKTGRMDLFGFSALWMFLQQWRALFHQFDRDRSGNINSNEMHQALVQLGYNLSPQFIQELMNRYSDRRRPGAMQLDRFIQVCTQLQSMTEAFRQKDTGMTGNVRMNYEDFLSSTISRLM